MTAEYLASFPSPEINYAAGGPGVVTALRTRHSASSFEPRAQLPFLALGRILNESVGLTTRFGCGSPSPGAVRPLRCFVAVHAVERLQPGVYRYDPEEHGLRGGPLCRPHGLMELGHVQPPIASTESFHVFIVADLALARTAYREHAERFVLLEAGHIAQSMLLLAVSEGLAACPIGHFDRVAVGAALGLDPATHPVVHSVAFGQPPAP